ncbi:hypothetical protein [Methylosinus sp. sav-2]|uniref:hypothetical protein n=1 Tax=Methylosinus sp. sav-2 TaxID=2485168 RepID=UPI001066985D|nr:hypothetical protein [Methylosinus sp. sav-2]
MNSNQPNQFSAQGAIPRSEIKRLLEGYEKMMETLPSEERNAPLRPVWERRRLQLISEWRIRGVDVLTAEKLALADAYSMQHLGNERGDERVSILVRSVESKMLSTRIEGAR